jgi:hypothetical protein
MNPGDTRTFELWATEFGVTKANQRVNVRVVTGGRRTAGGLAVTVLGGGKTAANGRAQVRFTASAPGAPRAGDHMDGQIYLVAFDWDVAVAPAAPDWRGLVVVKVFDTHPAVANPKWADVKDILTPYARLYPMMKARLDLSDHATVKANKDAVKATLNYPETDPRYMPVSRDLSRDKKALVLRWIGKGAL